jgi:hypothetical protein
MPDKLDITFNPNEPIVLPAPISRVLSITVTLSFEEAMETIRVIQKHFPTPIEHCPMCRQPGLTPDRWDDAETMLVCGNDNCPIVHFKK